MDDEKGAGERAVRTPSEQADLRPIEGTDADDELASLAKAVGHPARVQILRLIARNTACICGDVVDELPLAHRRCRST